MGHRFLRKDYDALVAKIEDLGHGMWKLGQEKKLWADPSPETWHDNFGYEQAEQQQWALSERAEDLVQMKNDAEIVERRLPGEVDIGSRVAIEDIESGERKHLVVGSYQVLDQQHDDEISYAARWPGPSWAPRPAKSARLQSATGRHCSASSASSSGQERSDRAAVHPR
jgi:hypothetical protein